MISIGYNNKHTYFYDKQTNVKLKGITTLIKKHFFHPKWNFLQVSGKNRQKKQSGPIRGIRLDKELKQWVKLLKNSKTKMSTFATFKNKIHPYTRKLLGFLTTKNWIPIHAQLAVGHVPSRMATAIDLVVREGKRLLLIEIKTGYNETFTKIDWTGVWKSMSSPFESFAANACNYSFVQIAWSWALYNLTFDKTADDAIVLNINDDGVYEYSLPKEMGLLLLSTIKEIMTIKKKARKRIKLSL
jgi:hypothetical protein